MIQFSSLSHLAHDLRHKERKAEKRKGKCCCPASWGKAAGEGEKGDKFRQQLGYAFLRKKPCHQTYDQNPEFSHRLTTDPVSSGITGPEEARK